MKRYLIGRLGQFILVIFAASAIVFLALQVVADPVQSMLPLSATEATKDLLREELGLNDPVLVQYARFVGNAVQGDFGDSLWLRQPALDAALSRVPATMMIALPATLLGVLLGALIGIAGGLRPGSPIDNALNTSSYLLLSMAEFWLGIMLVLIFSVQLGWLPTGGYEPALAFLVLPVGVLAIRPFAHTAQMMRSTMIKEGGKQYVTTARAKGASEKRVAFRHMLRNAAIPVLTLALYDLSRLFAGTAVAIEVIFAWPGIGRLAVGGLERGDVFLVQAVVIVAAVVVAGLNLMGDLLNFWLDPRTRSVVKERAA